ncbi:penicillin-binding protein activator [Actibacterium sp. 188UL27-1]|uniref:penicillin-binding protein activator n=1 Tax=Actibacterium sp. 188UL27-1 TaxID=2786961 RepID=UPI001EF618E4|nr:penicillin-binding protein activator [Actibacterium sp. 188UL27-1]
MISRSLLLRVLTMCSVLWLAACDNLNLPNTGTGPSINTRDAVPVALLVPGGSADGQQNALAQSLENAARLAISDLDGVAIDLRIYNTTGTASGAQTAAIEAVDKGAKIILGPVFAESANAAGVAVASKGVNVLAFSNNPAIAGGNVFILGQTFDNTAERLVRYAEQNGKGQIFVVNGRSVAEEVARDAITRSVSGSGATLVGATAFDLSQQAVVAAVPNIVSQVKSSGADAVFFTSGNEGAMGFLAQLLPENGLSPTVTQYVGMARLDIPPQALAQPGLQGTWFALSDPALNNRFRARYTAAYGSEPIEIAGRAYDGIAAIGALVKQGDANALSKAALTRGSGFVGVDGIFRLRNDGTNQRGLAIAQIRNNKVVVIDPAPRSFGGAGF